MKIRVAVLDYECATVKVFFRDAASPDDLEDELIGEGVIHGDCHFMMEALDNDDGLTMDVEIDEVMDYDKIGFAKKTKKKAKGKERDDSGTVS